MPLYRQKPFTYQHTKIDNDNTYHRNKTDSWVSMKTETHGDLSTPTEQLSHSAPKVRGNF